MINGLGVSPSSSKIYGTHIANNVSDCRVKQTHVVQHVSRAVGVDFSSTSYLSRLACLVTSVDVEVRVSDPQFSVVNK